MTKRQAEAKGRRRRCEDLLANLEKTREYWKYKDTALYRPMRRTIFCENLWASCKCRILNECG